MDAFFLLIKDYQVIFSSAVAIGSTFFIVRGNRKTAAMTNATNVVREIGQDLMVQEGLRYIRNWHKEGNKASIGCLSGNCDEDMKDQKAAIFHVLNQYEKLAVGINNGIYSEKVVKESSAGTIIHLYSVTKPLIDVCRTTSSRPTIWQEIEILAKKWDKKPLKKKY